ncbi:MAG: lipid-A-disaccharide synthase [Rudaea sp.]|nr:lipid-A-disaccharide synthase [Rudaea sp.]
MGIGESKQGPDAASVTDPTRRQTAPDRSQIPIPDSPLFVLVAGEASGDQLGAGLIGALRERFPAARFAGIGGPRMAAAGMQIWHPAEKLSVMGLVEVLRHLPQLLAIRRDVYKLTLYHRPEVFIGIDAPDFNLGLERRLKRAGVRTVHYVSPSVWAWREKRAARIGRSADRVLCLFPMEPPIYARHGVGARFVGHPLADAFALEPDQAAARRALELPADVPVLAVLPGSRLGEIRRLGRDFLEAAVLLKQRLPQLHIVAPMANLSCRNECERLLDSDSRFRLLNSRLLDGNAHQAMIAADAVLLASGTAALEAMLAKRPMVVAYRLAPLTYRIVTWLGMLRTNVYSLPNILAAGPLVPELMQDACTPAGLAESLLPFLRARSIPQEMSATFLRLHLALRGDADRSAAAAIAALIESHPAATA